MQLSLSPNIISEKLFGTLRRYHVVLFSVFVVGGLAAAIFLLNNTLTSASTPTTPTGGQLNFDQSTLDAIDKMYASDQVNKGNADQYGLKINQPRTNPLVAE